MDRIYAFLFFLVLLLSGCEFNFRNSDNAEKIIEIQRYDRMESVYLTTGDFSALQQMETGYPMETRTLIENILKIGAINDPEINNNFLAFFQDTTLQVLISDVSAQYADMDDINLQLNMAFNKLVRFVPGLPVPKFYSQIGSLDQSIVVGDDRVGISLDKYMGEDYPLYKRFYTDFQRKSMTRAHIVPDCLCFYLISLYPLQGFDTRSQYERDMHVGKMMWVCNQALGYKFFKTKYVEKIAAYMRQNPHFSIENLLKSSDYSMFN